MSPEVVCPATHAVCPHEKCANDNQLCVMGVDAINNEVAAMIKRGMGNSVGIWDFTQPEILKLAIILRIPSQQIKNLAVERQHRKT